MAVQVFLLAGQSNAFGRTDPAGLTDQTLRSTFPAVQMAEQLECPNDDGAGACDVQSSEWADLGPHSDDGTMGPGLTLGRTLHQRLWPHGAVHLITVGTSGSTLANDWDPAATTGRVLYTRLIDFVEARMAQISGASHICGMAWVHGETDANTDANSFAYASRLSTFVSALYRDLNGCFPIAMVRLSSQSGKQAARLAAMRNAVDNFANRHHLIRSVNVDDTPLAGVHFTADSYATVGRRLGHTLADAVEQVGHPYCGCGSYGS